MLYRMRFAVISIVLLAITAAQARSVTPLVVVGQSETMMVINEIPLTGTVTSPRSADLSAELSGLVEAIKIKEGQRVRKGDVILKLDQELEKLTLDAAIAKSRQARLQLADAKLRQNFQLLRPDSNGAPLF